MEKVLRSLIHEVFPFDLRVDIELMSRRRDISNQEKQQEIIMLLQNYGIDDITKLGPGTNRYAFKIRGFVVKVATDHDGKIDNLKEFKMAKRLFPHVAMTYEVSESGTLLVAEYIPPFESYTEMCQHSDKIRKILRDLSSTYLIGDVGISPINFGNWGLRSSTREPVCLDFAYVYEVSSKLFICKHCKSNSMLIPDENFNKLFCPNTKCGHEYRFEDIRAMIGNDLHRHEIGDLGEEGYRMTESFVLTELTESRSNYLIKQQKKEKKKKKEKEEPEPESLDKDDESKEEPLMYESEFAKSFAGQPFAPTPIILRGVSIPAGAGDREYLPQATSYIDEKDARPATVTPPKKPKIGDVAFRRNLSREVVLQGVSHIPGKEDEEDERNDIVPPQPREDVDVVEGESLEADAPDISGAFSGLEDDIPDPEPESVGEEVVEEEPPVEDTTVLYPDKIPDSFLEEVGRAISLFSNKAEAYIRSLHLYEKMKGYLNNKKRFISELDFYKPCQNAVYRSLATMMKFEEVQKPKDSGIGTFKTFVPSEDPNGKEYFPTMMFLYLAWSDGLIQNSQNVREIMEKYRAKYDMYMGVQEEWKQIFAKRLRSKLAIDVTGSNEIAKVLGRIFCTESIPVPPANAAPVEEAPSEVPEVVNEVPEENSLDICTKILAGWHERLMGADSFNLDDMLHVVIYEAIVGSQHLEMYADLVKLMFVIEIDGKVVNHVDFTDVASMSTRLNPVITRCYEIIIDLMEKVGAQPVPQEESNPDPIVGSHVLGTSPSIVGEPVMEPVDDEEGFEDEEDDGEDDEDDESEFPEVTIEVNLDEKYDLIHIIAYDGAGKFILPIYDKIEDTEIPDTKHSVIDDRNGEWDWLIHIPPHMVFTTNDPEKFIRMNQEDDGLQRPKFVILDQADDIYIMGCYMVNPVEVYDSDGELIEDVEDEDEDFLMKLNILINNNIAYTAISYLKWIDEIERATEAEVLDMIKDFTDGDDDDEEDPDEEEDDGISDDVDEQIREGSDLARRLLLNRPIGEDSKTAEVMDKIARGPSPVGDGIVVQQAQPVSIPIPQQMPQSMPTTQPPSKPKKNMIFKPIRNNSV